MTFSKGVKETYILDRFSSRTSIGHHVDARPLGGMGGRGCGLRS